MAEQFQACPFYVLCPSCGLVAFAPDASSRYGIRRNTTAGSLRLNYDHLVACCCECGHEWKLGVPAKMPSPDERMAEREQQYSYSFSAWPDEVGWSFNKDIYRLFRSLNDRVEDQFTEAEFGLFRERLGQHGITLREVERVPYHEPEAVH